MKVCGCIGTVAGICGQPGSDFWWLGADIDHSSRFHFQRILYAGHCFRTAKKVQGWTGLVEDLENILD